MLKTFKTKEEIPEELREGAIETKDEQWIVDVPDPELGEGGKKAIQKERDLREAAERKQRETEEENGRLKREQEARDKGVPEAEIKRIREEEALARKPILDENATLKSKLDKLERQNTVRSIGQKVWVEDRIDDALEAALKRIRQGDAGGLIVTDKDGKDTAETLEHFINETLKAEKGWLYLGKNPSGGQRHDADGDTTPAPVANPHADRVRAAF